MFASFLIALREGIEAALIVGIILSFLDKTNNQTRKREVWYGVFVGILVSILVGGLLVLIGVQFEGRTGEIFEGVTLLIAASILTWVIFWLRKQNPTEKIEKQTDDAISTQGKNALFLLAFLSVVREGIELALFLFATQISSGGIQTILGALLGLIMAVLLGWLIFKSARRVSIKSFFQITNILLIFVAAGMVAYGVHELNEAGIIPSIVDEVWNINHILSDKSEIGLFLKALFGYNGNPSLSEVIAYTLYLLGVGMLFRQPNKQPR